MSPVRWHPHLNLTTLSIKIGYKNITQCVVLAGYSVKYLGSGTLPIILTAYKMFRSKFHFLILCETTDLVTFRVSFKKVNFQINVRIKKTLACCTSTVFAWNSCPHLAILAELA